jgi:ring-1,2-phenylacetyl-CoA epoxidase subunit PaaE
MIKFHSLALQSREQVAEDAYCLTFAVPTELQQDYRFLPGQHLAIRATLNGRALRRTYSVVSPAGGELKIGVRVQGEMSRYLALQLPLNESLEVMTPNGSFHPQLTGNGSKFYMGIAAGSGITPLVSIIASTLAAEPDAQFLLIYANRDSAHAMFVEEILALKNQYVARFAVHFVMSREPQEIDLFNGRIDAIKLRTFASTLFDVSQVDEYFLCGPGAMLEELSAELRVLGTKGKVHVERFGAVAKAGANPVGPVERITVAAGMAEVTILIDGRRRAFKMSMNDEFILDAAERAGIELPFACRAGVCSTCRTKLAAGKVDMEYNQALEEWEVAAGYVLCCQSRPATSQVELNYDDK